MFSKNLFGLLLILSSCYCADPNDCILSEWSQWGSCSNKCTPGVKTMTRTIMKDMTDIFAKPCDKNRTHSIPCGVKNNGCEQFCDVKSGDCGCRMGLTLNSDNKTCIDNDECKINFGRGPCVQKCINTFGSYRCGCHPSYYLDEDKRSCVFNQSYKPAANPAYPSTKNTTDANNLPQWALILIVCFNILLVIALCVICYLCKDKCKRAFTREIKDPLLIHAHKLKTFNTVDDCENPRYIEIFDSKPLKHDESVEHIYEPIGNYEPMDSAVQNSCADQVYEEPIDSSYVKKNSSVDLKSDLRVYEPMDSDVKKNSSVDLKCGLPVYEPMDSDMKKNSFVDLKCSLPVYEPMSGFSCKEN